MSLWVSCKFILFSLFNTSSPLDFRQIIGCIATLGHLRQSTLDLLAGSIKALISNKHREFARGCTFNFLTIVLFYHYYRA
ncbi:hypothetical protein CC78DRAFT_529279 [Lojkania enalia]|uniref:Secreted protein n=1 Tax=Lojkania enalia TaxID=147567 RepID=A0A9P4TQH2_9PLEO|nr:hypothetical protein CC78DRAFT_529279 [Didymosphaeria enalia]